MKDLVKTMESNQQAFDLIKKAQSNNTITSIIGGTGGFLVSWPIETAIGGGDANWILAGVGAGLIAISIPLTSGANKNGKQAVELYNSSLNSTSFYKLEKTKITSSQIKTGLWISVFIIIDAKIVYICTSLVY